MTDEKLRNAERAAKKSQNDPYSRERYLSALKRTGNHAQFINEVIQKAYADVFEIIKISVTVLDPFPTVRVYPDPDTMEEEVIYHAGLSFGYRQNQYNTKRVYILLPDSIIMDCIIIDRSLGRRYHSMVDIRNGRNLETAAYLANAGDAISAINKEYERRSLAKSTPPPEPPIVGFEPTGGDEWWRC